MPELLDLHDSDLSWFSLDARAGVATFTFCGVTGRPSDQLVRVVSAAFESAVILDNHPVDDGRIVYRGDLAVVRDGREARRSWEEAVANVGPHSPLGTMRVESGGMAARLFNVCSVDVRPVDDGDRETRAVRAWSEELSRPFDGARLRQKRVVGLAYVELDVSRRVILFELAYASGERLLVKGAYSGKLALLCDGYAGGPVNWSGMRPARDPWVELHLLGMGLNLWVEGSDWRCIDMESLR